jgi:hypothetical protein
MLNASVGTATVDPPAVSITAAVVISDGEQLASPPDEGTTAAPSTWYVARVTLALRTVPPDDHAPALAEPADTSIA